MTNNEKQWKDYFAPNKMTYIINYEGRWKFIKTRTGLSGFDPAVTDIIWFKDTETMIASWWLKRNGKRLKRNEKVEDSDMVMILLQVEDA